MQIKLRFASLLMLAALTPLSALASSDVCWDASVAASRSDSWIDFQKAIERCSYSDGAYAELKAEGVTRLLTQHWLKLPELKSIQSKDPAFLQLVLNYLDDTIPQDEASTIYKLAAEACPTDCKELCDRISQRVGPRN